MQTCFDDDGETYAPTTNGGYYLDQVISALQKEIRRGNQYKAVYWAVELEGFNREKRSGATILWNRLKVIASEDVSIAEPHAPLIISALKQFYDEAVKREDSAYNLFFVHAVIFLARCRKCRIVDDLVVTLYGNKKFNHEWIPMPDYAVDIHTKAGGWKGVAHFLEEGCKLRKEAFKNPFKETAGKFLIEHGMRWLKFPSKTSTQGNSSRRQNKSIKIHRSSFVSLSDFSANN
jgi:hypothetical protein